MYYFNHRNDCIFIKFLLFVINELYFLSSSVRNSEILNTLNSIRRRKANENSRPAKPRIKKVREIKFKSSFIAPVKIDKVYNVNHDNSE